jgi:hypothetical protein
LGDNVLFCYDENRLLRIHLAKGLDVFRNNYLEKGYAAELIHINPLKDWNLVEEFVIKTGCGNFTRKDTNNIEISSRNNTIQYSVYNNFRAIRWTKHSNQEPLQISQPLYAIIILIMMAMLVLFSRLTAKTYFYSKKKLNLKEEN